MLSHTMNVEGSKPVVKKENERKSADTLNSWVLKLVYSTAETIEPPTCTIAVNSSKQKKQKSKRSDTLGNRIKSQGTHRLEIKYLRIFTRYN